MKTIVEEFKTLLNNVDWYYFMSDDRRAETRYNQQIRNIDAFIEQYPEHGLEDMFIEAQTKATNRILKK